MVHIHISVSWVMETFHVRFFDSSEKFCHLIGKISSEIFEKQKDSAIELAYI